MANRVDRPKVEKTVTRDAVPAFAGMTTWRAVVWDAVPAFAGMTTLLR